MTDPSTEPQFTELIAAPRVDAAAGGAPLVPPDEPTRAPRRRFSRRTAVIAAAAALVLAIGGTIAGVAIARDVDRRDAVAALASARADLGDAEARLQLSTADRAAGADELAQSIAAVDAGVTAAGSRVGPTLALDLVAARDAAVAVQTADAGFELPDAVAVEEVDADALEPAAIRAAAADVAAAVRETDDRAQTVDAAAEALTTAVDDLETGATRFATGLADVGAALLADRADAADDVKAALQAQLDALPEAHAAGLADAVNGYLAAADAVVMSSTQARVPKGGGSGYVVSDAASLTVVVNKQRALPSDYVPGGLVVPAGVPNTNGQPMRFDAAAAMQAMAADAATAGIQLRIASGYRSYSTQRSVYNGFVAKEGVAGADTHSARPGHSEHQTGLVADIDDGTGCSIQQCFAGKPGGIWLAANSWKHGFILRYGDGWQPIVGYTFEPWHYRYVGVDVATDMHDRGVRSLEEYFGLPAAPGY